MCGVPIFGDAAASRFESNRHFPGCCGVHGGSPWKRGQPGPPTRGEPEMAKANQSPRPVRSPARGQATPLVRATLRLGIAACDVLAVSGGVAERAALAR